MIDRAGAIVERPALDGRLRQGRSRRAVFAACQGYAYDPYGSPLVRESAGRGDCDSDTDLDSTDSTRVNAVQAGTKWDARADMDDDGDVDLTDISLWTTKSAAWGPPHGLGAPTVAQAFSDIGNPHMFQGVPHFALDTASNATTTVLPLNQHRLRFNDCVTGRWITRDPIGYADSANLYEFVRSRPSVHVDPAGTDILSGLQLGSTLCAAAIEIITSIPLRSGDYGAAYSHCYSHCLSTRYCGRQGSNILGGITELWQAGICELYKSLGRPPPTGVCESALQRSDFWDNELGRELAGHSGSCFSQCENAMGAIKHLEGPDVSRKFGPRMPDLRDRGPWPWDWRAKLRPPFFVPGRVKPKPGNWPPAPALDCWMRHGQPGPGMHWETDRNGNCMAVFDDRRQC